MKNRTLILVMLTLVSCARSEEKAVIRYWDIKGFFESEVQRLTKSKKPVDKTVTRNKISETQTRRSVNWKNELSLFIESDINKPAWRDSYKITEDNSEIIYMAIDSNLRTRAIQIKKDVRGGLRHISIINQTKNNLYQSSEQLTYVPDSVYKIDKSQHVLLLGNNRYQITGVFK